MNKETIIRLVKQQPIKQEEFNQFILDYIKFKEKQEPTAEQLIKIIQLINAGVFSLKEAVGDGIVMHNLQVQTIVNNNQVIRIDVI